MKKIRSKNTDQGIITSNGIVIDGDIALSTGLEINKDRSFIIRIMLAMIASVSTVQILGSFLEVSSVSFLPAVLMCLCIAAIVTKNPLIKSAGIGYLVLQAIYFFISKNMISDGFYLLLDKYFQRAGISSAEIQDAVRKIPKSDVPDSISRFMIFIGSVIALLVAVSCIVRLDFAILFVSTFPFVEIGLYHGWEAPTLYIIALVLVWIVVITIALVNHSTNKAGVNNTFAVHRRKKAYYFTSKQLKNKFFTVYMTTVAIICAAVFAAAILFSSLSGFVRPKAFTNLRKNITEAINNFSFTSLQNLLADYDGGFDIFAVKTVGGTNGGRLGERDGITFDGSTALNAKIKMRPSDTLYLRGYVAGKYEDNCWDPIDEEPSSDLKNAFDGEPLQNFNYEMFNSAGLGRFDTENKISIAVIGASRRFAYAPYFTDYLSDDNEDKNERVQPTDEGYVKLRSRKYILDFLDVTKLGPEGTNASMIDSVLYYFSANTSNTLSLKNRLYYNFVRENYTDVPHSETLNRVFETISSGFGANSRFEIGYTSQCIEAIKRYFNSRGFYYNLTPGKTPSGEDFIDHFLEHPEKSGYCSYYASAGVMLMRMFGFPARYVEGYIVTPNEFEVNGTSLEADITDKAAHAWCEIFIEGIGWLPVEFTPGFSGGINPNQPADPKTTETTTVTTTVTSAAPPSQTTFGTSLTKGSASSAKSETSAVTSATDTASSENKWLDPNGGGGGGKGTGSGSEGLSVFAKVVIADALFIIIVLAIVLLHRSYKLKKKRKLIRQTDRNEAVKYIYAYYLKYLSLLNITDSSNISDEKQALKLIGTCHKLELDCIAGDLSNLSELAIEAEHSNKELSDKEYVSALEMLRKLSDDVVKQKLSGFGRFVSKWLYGMY
ncbi:MAG: transglutaminase domain-containing protein [Ruminococcus sp.]|nr:transglutaminase domain-containing protein [Ruminococcus sp.]